MLTLGENLGGERGDILLALFNDDTGQDLDVAPDNTTSDRL